MNSPFYLENELFHYVNELRRNPRKFCSVLSERKSFFVGNEKYSPPCLVCEDEYIEKKDGVECIDQCISFLSEQKSLLKELKNDRFLGNICKGQSLQGIGFGSSIHVISIPFRKREYETSQQILLDLFLDNLSRTKLFCPESRRIGIGFFKHFNWERMIRNGMENVFIQLLIAPKVHGLESIGRILHIKPRFEYSSLTFNYEIFCEDKYFRNEKISLEEEIIVKNNKKKMPAMGMIIEETESLNLDFKQFKTSLNINQPDYFRQRADKENFCEDIAQVVKKYFIAYMNTDLRMNGDCGRLVFGVEDKSRMIDPVPIDRDMENRIRNEIVKTISNEVIPKIEEKPESCDYPLKCEFVRVRSNFRSMKIIVISVKKKGKHEDRMKYKCQKGKLGYAIYFRELDSVKTIFVGF